MANSKSEDIFALVKSLSKSEKRSLRLFAQRIQDTDSLEYMTLFDVLDKMSSFDNEEVLRKMNGISPSKYSNLKRHLYEQILFTLRLTKKTQYPNIRIRELIDYSYVLYGKGLYMQALKVLSKAKKLAEKNHTDFSLLMIIEIEKMIHSRHITRSKREPLNDLEKEAQKTTETISNRVSLSNLRLVLHKFYVEKGHVKNEDELEQITAFFQEYSSQIEEEQLGMMERVYLRQSYVTYYFILNDFEQCLLYSKQWVKLFEESKELQVRDIDLYFRGYHYLLTSAYNLKRVKEHREYLKQIEKFRKENYKIFNNNTQIESFLRVHSGRLNQHFLDGSFEAGIEKVNSTLRRIHRYREKLDEHKIMVLYYKIAWMYFGTGKADEAVQYLQYIINNTSASLRDDIQTYSRILLLMAHFDLQNFDVLPFLNKQYTNFFEKVKEKNKVQKLALKFFRDVIHSPVTNRKELMHKYILAFEQLQEDDFERRAFLYLEILPWLESKVSKKSIGQIIAERNGVR